ncbi:hypothetical protein CGRA01v4_03924 [Colletotrichum graminicola]|nr:hypothetical protein CGRA01v4_03924 [Colletotrichum graminicola]
MSSPTRRSESPEFSVCDDDDGRARITASNIKNKFWVGDLVYLRTPGGGKEGPFLIETVPAAGKYTLCTEAGVSVRKGEQFEEKDLD